MVDSILHAIPLVIALAIYFVRVEVRLATIQRDICWIKTRLIQCPQRSEELTQ